MKSLSWIPYVRQISVLLPSVRQSFQPSTQHSQLPTPTSIRSQRRLRIPSRGSSPPRWRIWVGFHTSTTRLFSSLLSVRYLVVSTSAGERSRQSKISPQSRGIPHGSIYSDRCDDNPDLNSMTNVLKLLANGCDWPRLRHLDMRYLFAEVDHLKTFVALHAAAGTLKTLEIHGDLICADVTPERGAEES